MKRLYPIAVEEIPADRQSDYYQVTVKCSNCDLWKSLSFNKGKKVNFHLCPNCGCRSLHLN